MINHKHPFVFIFYLSSVISVYFIYLFFSSSVSASCFQCFPSSIFSSFLVEFMLQKLVIRILFIFPHIFIRILFFIVIYFRLVSSRPYCYSHCSMQVPQSHTVDRLIAFTVLHVMLIRRLMASTNAVRLIMNPLLTVPWSRHTWCHELIYSREATLYFHINGTVYVPWLRWVMGNGWCSDGNITRKTCGKPRDIRSYLSFAMDRWSEELHPFLLLRIFGQPAPELAVCFSKQAFSIFVGQCAF